MLNERDNEAAETAVEQPGERRLVLKASLATLAALGGGAFSTLASAQTPISDAAILNFALNLEYLEAEYYVRGLTGAGLTAAETSGTGTQGSVVGGRQVNFTDTALQQIFAEITTDERAHVNFLRAALGAGAVSEPSINFTATFNTLAQAAGLGSTFDPFASQENFLLGAYVFEDVGVTAYHGGSRFIQNKSYLDAAAGILAVEAYHAATLRTLLYQKGFSSQANAISGVRAALGGGADQGITLNGVVNIVPTDANSLAFDRTPGQVLNVVYAGGQANNFGFFPNRVNGPIN